MWYNIVRYFYRKLNISNKIRLIEEEVDITLISDIEKKKVILLLLEDLVNGTTSSIDSVTAERILKTVIKSVGNEITAFVVRK